MAPEGLREASEGGHLDDLVPEERHRVYKLLRLNARARPDWPLEITGIFAEVAEEAEMGLSSCKLS